MERQNGYVVWTRLNGTDYTVSRTGRVELLTHKGSVMPVSDALELQVNLYAKGIDSSVTDYYGNVVRTLRHKKQA